MIQKGPAVVFEFAVGIDIPADIFQPVPGGHHDLSGRQQLTRKVGGAGRAATSAFGTGIGVQQVPPAQIEDVFGPEAGGGTASPSPEGGALSGCMAYSTSFCMAGILRSLPSGHSLA